MSIPFLDLTSQMAEVIDEVRDDLEDVLRSCAFVGGPHVAEFEAAFAAACDVAHCVGVANGTDAVELALRAIGVEAGAEVIIPANTFIATAEAVSRLGAVPVPVDVDPVHLLMDPEAAKAALTSRTQALVPVHLYGQMAPMAGLRAVADAAGIALVEDAAQSQGARQGRLVSGSVGDVAATSFYPGKNLGAAGDAGAVTTNHQSVADRVRIIAAHGSRRKYDHELVGVNSRLDALQAVVLKAKLRRLEGWNEARRAAASRYATMLADLPGVRLPVEQPGNTHVWHLYVVQVEDRDGVAKRLGEHGVGTGIHYPVPVHLTPAYSHLGIRAGALPVAERAADRILSLPMFPHLSAEQQERVVNALDKALQ